MDGFAVVAVKMCIKLVIETSLTKKHIFLFDNGSNVFFLFFVKGQKKNGQIGFDML